jgi:hypothetical protein
MAAHFDEQVYFGGRYGEEEEQWDHGGACDFGGEGLFVTYKSLP